RFLIGCHSEACQRRPGADKREVVGGRIINGIRPIAGRGSDLNNAISVQYSRQDADFLQIYDEQRGVL
ncbi:MAG: hypothetical protein ACI9VS_002384, partial [Candidatus Binatia bacterium]